VSRRLSGACASPYILPELSTKLAYKANRDGGAEPVAEPAVHKRLAGDWALRTHDAQRLTALERSIVQAATHQAANTLDRVPTVPAIGKILSLVRREELADMARFPRGPACVSAGRLVTCAKQSAGTRVGPSGNTIGHAALTWALAAAAAWFLGHHPAGPKHLTRLEHQPGQGKARTLRAHRLAWAVDDMRTHPTAFAMAKVLPGEGSRAGAPDASLDTHGSSRQRAGSKSCWLASLNAKVRLDLLARNLGPLIGHPRWPPDHAAIVAPR
jgi:hypothetical protein